MALPSHSRLLPPLLLASLLAPAGCGDDGGPLPAGGTQPPVVHTSPADPDGPVEPVDDPTPVEEDGFFLLSVEPSDGPSSGLMEVQLRGAGLDDVVDVRFGESAAVELFAVTPKLIVALTPPRPRGLVDVTVIAANGERAVLGAAYAYEEDVAVTGIEPDGGDALGGEPVTVTGSGFAPGAVLILGGRKALATEVVDDRTITAITPEASEPGLVDVHVSSEYGAGRLRDAFRYYRAASIATVTPPTGPLEASTAVTIEGAALERAVAVTVAGRPASSFEVVSAGRIDAVFPPATAPGAANVAVITPWTSAVARAAFTYLPAAAPDGLELLAVFPGHGPLAGGGAVQLTVAGDLDALTPSEVELGDATVAVEVVDAGAGTLRVTAPAATEPGPVDVRLLDGEGAVLSELKGGYNYELRPVIESVTPGLGPVEGGTAMTISGGGFAPGAAVRVGALPASHVEVVDEGTITAVTPAGSPGSASVTVVQSGLTATLPGGFYYVGNPEVWLVEPPMGSIGGGTLVTVVGAGFGAGTRVTFGGADASDVRLISSTVIEARTPPGTLGPADVAAYVPGAADAIRPNAFIYYDPASEPGAWGGPLDGNLNVAVFDFDTGRRLAEAAVLVGLDPYGTYRGLTDANGLITFGGPDLFGDKTITVTKDGYGTFQMDGVDAVNVVVGIPPVPECQDMEDQIDCDPPPGSSATLTGRVVNPYKGLKIPWGDCADHPGRPDGLCASCDQVLACKDESLACSEIPGRGNACTSACEADADCPTGFDCLPLPADPLDLRCLPSAGEPTTLCAMTTDGLDPTGQATWPPNLAVDANYQFTTSTGLGEYAVYCFSGLRNVTTGDFTPQIFGVARHRTAFADGDHVTAEIRMEHPVNKDVPIILDRPRIGPAGTESGTIRVVLDLGSDGVLDFPPIQVAGTEPGKTRFLTTILHSLKGNLADASYTLSAALRSSFEPAAVSVTWERELRDVQNDLALRLEAGGWVTHREMQATVNAVSGADGQALAVGEDGRILRSFGNGYWAQGYGGSEVDLFGVHLLPGGAAIAVGEGGTALHFDGDVWNRVETGTMETLEGVWMAALDDAWAVGGRAILRWDGLSWEPDMEAPHALHDVWGAPDGTVWIVGDGGYVARREEDGSWLAVASGTNSALRAVSGTADGDLFICGDSGVFLRWGEGGLESVPPPTGADLRDVWAATADDVHVVGRGGTLLHFDGSAWREVAPEGYHSDLLAVGGSGAEIWALGSHELVLGPMLAIPENVYPDALSFLDGTISWNVATPSVRPDFSVVTLQGSSDPCEVCGMLYSLPYDEWTTALDGDLDRVYLPDMTPVAGVSGLIWGFKPMTVLRVLVDGPFDFDNATAGDFQEGLWRSWATYDGSVYYDDFQWW